LIVSLIRSPGPVFWPALVVTSTIAAMIAARIAITSNSPMILRARLAAEGFGAAAGAGGAGRGPGAGRGAGARRVGAVAGSSTGSLRVAPVGGPVIARVAASLSGSDGSVPASPVLRATASSRAVV
jgi:hypothetical protein